MTEFLDDQYWGHMPPPPIFPQGHRHTHVPVISNVGDDERYDALVISDMGEGPKGEKGDPTYFDDLTEEQLQEIYRAASFVGNKTEDAVVTTTGTSTTVIEIPFDYDEFDMLFVDVNGLDLAEGDDYTIVDNSISLDTSLPAGQDVHFRLLRYDVVDGNKNIVNIMGRKDYNTVAEMQADTELESGDICHTLDFGWYKVVSHAVADGNKIVALDNGLFAVLQEDIFIVPIELSVSDFSDIDGDDVKSTSKVLLYEILEGYTPVTCIGKINDNIQPLVNMWDIQSDNGYWTGISFDFVKYGDDNWPDVDIDFELKTIFVKRGKVSIGDQVTITV